MVMATKMAKKINKSNWLKNNFAHTAHFFVHFFAFVCTTRM